MEPPQRPASAKLAWSGIVTSVQPRIRLGRSYNERFHNYFGYLLALNGSIGDETRDFIVAIGPGAHAKHQFRTGDLVSGSGLPVPRPDLEIAELYKASQLTVIERSPDTATSDPPPWLGVPPPIPVYRHRGHRRLESQTYDAICTTCIWGCKMPTEITPDNWKPHVRRYRIETFCYGPLACPRYVAGPARKVPGRGGLIYTEGNAVDKESTSHRTPSE
jgi:hypothetical protein